MLLVNDVQNCIGSTEALPAIRYTVPCQPALFNAVGCCDILTFCATPVFIWNLSIQYAVVLPGKSWKNVPVPLAVPVWKTRKSPFRTMFFPETLCGSSIPIVPALVMGEPVILSES